MNIRRFLRSSYVGQAFNDYRLFDAELIQNVINEMKRGKAAGLDGVMTEHLQFSHYFLPCVLAKLFNIMLVNGHVGLYLLVLGNRLRFLY